jgi:hypothetical protein
MTPRIARLLMFGWWAIAVTAILTFAMRMIGYALGAFL